VKNSPQNWLTRSRLPRRHSTGFPETSARGASNTRWPLKASRKRGFVVSERNDTPSRTTVSNFRSIAPNRAAMRLHKVYPLHLTDRAGWMADLRLVAPLAVRKISHPVASLLGTWETPYSTLKARPIGAIALMDDHISSSGKAGLEPTGKTIKCGCS